MVTGASIYIGNSQIDWDIASDASSPIDKMMTHEFYEHLQAAIA